MNNIPRFGWLVILLLLIGCGRSGPENPAAPEPEEQESQAITATSDGQSGPVRKLLGLWDILVADDHLRAGIVPRRAGGMHVNLLNMLEDPVCEDCLRIDDIQVYQCSVWSADLTLTHPMVEGGRFTGFDVRGIYMSGSNYTFPESGRNIAWLDTPRALFADGYTSLFNPTEFPESEPGPGVFKYVGGKLARDGDLTATLNAYLAYAREEPRRMFLPGTDETRTLWLRIPGGPFKFGYAVDACWEPVGFVGNPVFDFPPGANCLEAYEVWADVSPELSTEVGTTAPIRVTVFDHQGLSTIESVSAEAPDLFAGEIALTYSEPVGDGGYVFTGTIPNDLGTGKGEYPLLVRVVDTHVDKNLGAVEAYQVCSVRIQDGWGRAWGGGPGDDTYGYGVAAGDSSHVYVTGNFEGLTDFDPGPGEDEHNAYYGYDAYVSGFDSTGQFQWAATWGGPGYASGNGVCVDDSGDVYVAGYFDPYPDSEQIDFNPGPGTDYHTTEGDDDAFLSKFSADGDFVWARTWGGGSYDMSYAVAMGAGDGVYVTGYFGNEADFDPGPGIDEWASKGDPDVFLSKFNSDGDFQWARAWGGFYYDEGYGIAVNELGDVYVTGEYGGTVDFDPGAGEDEHTAVYEQDVFLSKFNSDGDFSWARTWGGEGSYAHGDEGQAVAADNAGNAYVTGYFGGVVDFDPGPDILEIPSMGYSDVFLSKFDPGGNLVWVLPFASTGYDIGYGVCLDSAGAVLVTGYYAESIDFDPGPGTELRVPANNYDAFVVKLSQDAEFQWVRTWGGQGPSSYVEAAGYGVDADSDGNVYTAGYFRSYVIDLDPGPGIQLHTSGGYPNAFLTRLAPDGNW